MIRGENVVVVVLVVYNTSLAYARELKRKREELKEDKGRAREVMRNRAEEKR